MGADQGCRFWDSSAASASASTKNIVILFVAIPPTSAEAPDPADRFHFRFPAKGGRFNYFEREKH